MTTISQLLSTKGSEVYTVSPDNTVAEVLQLLADKNIGAVPILQEGKLVGIFSERDYVRNVISRGESLMDLPIKEIMTSQVRYVHPSQTLEEGMALMTSKHFRHLPVLSEEQALLGIISIGDVVKAVIEKQEFLIEQLESYITGA